MYHWISLANKRRWFLFNWNIIIGPHGHVKNAQYANILHVFSNIPILLCLFLAFFQSSVLSITVQARQSRLLDYTAV